MYFTGYLHLKIIKQINGAKSVNESDLISILFK